MRSRAIAVLASVGGISATFAPGAAGHYLGDSSNAPYGCASGWVAGFDFGNFSGKDRNDDNVICSRASNGNIQKDNHVH